MRLLYLPVCAVKHRYFNELICLSGGDKPPLIRAIRTPSRVILRFHGMPLPPAAAPRRSGGLAFGGVRLITAVPAASITGAAGTEDAAVGSIRQRIPGTRVSRAVRIDARAWTGAAAWIPRLHRQPFMAIGITA